MQVEYKKGKYSINMEEEYFNQLLKEIKFFVETTAKERPLEQVFNQLLPSSSLIMSLGEALKGYVKDDPKMNYKVKV